MGHLKHVYTLPFQLLDSASETVTSASKCRQSCTSAYLPHCEFKHFYLNLPNFGSVPGRRPPLQDTLVIFHEATTLTGIRFT